MLQALDHCHSKGIIHRDVKPQNIVVNHEKKEFKLIDFGLSEYFVPGNEMPVRVASRPYKGPELLVGFRTYDYSLDLWAVGCILAAMVDFRSLQYQIFQKDYMFLGSTNPDQLIQITKVLGTDDLRSYLSKYNITLDKKDYPNIQL